jgi:hypothetical protein
MVDCSWLIVHGVGVSLLLITAYQCILQETFPETKLYNAHN